MWIHQRGPVASPASDGDASRRRARDRLVRVVSSIRALDDSLRIAAIQYRARHFDADAQHSTACMRHMSVRIFESKALLDICMWASSRGVRNVNKSELRETKNRPKVRNLQP